MSDKQLEKAAQKQRDSFRPPRHYKKMNSTESNRVSNSPSVSPSYSQQERLSNYASRSPSPSQYDVVQNRNKLLPHNRSSSRSPSPVLQTRQGNASQPQLPVRNVNIQARQQHHQQSTIVNEQKSRKQLPPVPVPMKRGQPQQQQQKNFLQINEESGDEFDFGNSQRKGIQHQNQYIPMTNVQTQRRKMPAVTNQPMRVGGQPSPMQRYANRAQPSQQIQIPQRGQQYNTVVSYQHDVRLTKQYASMGDDEDNENENWF